MPHEKVNPNDEELKEAVALIRIGNWWLHAIVQMIGLDTETNMSTSEHSTETTLGDWMVAADAFDLMYRVRHEGHKATEVELMDALIELHPERALAAHVAHGKENALGIGWFMSQAMTSAHGAVNPVKLRDAFVERMNYLTAAVQELMAAQQPQFATPEEIRARSEEYPDAK